MNGIQTAQTSSDYGIIMKDSNYNYVTHNRMLLPSDGGSHDQFKSLNDRINRSFFINSVLFKIKNNDVKYI